MIPLRAVTAIAIAFAAAVAAAAKPCPAVIGVTATGTIFNERGGAWVRQSPAVLEQVLQGGCYPEGGPSPTSSVALYLAPGAPKARVTLVYSILERSGWPRQKVTAGIWKNSPQEPK